MLPGRGAGRDGGDRWPEGRLRCLPGGSAGRRTRIRPRDRQHRWLEGDASGVAGAVPEGGHPALLPARVAQDPGPGQALEGAVRGGFPAGLGGVPRARPPPVRAPARSAPAVGEWTPQWDRLGEGPGSLREAPTVVGRVPSSRRSSHQQQARSCDAGDEPLLRSRPTPARLARGVPTALPRVGVVVELPALAPGDDAEEPGLAVPRRTPQPAPVSRRLVAKPVDLRVPGGIPLSTPTKTVTVRHNRRQRSRETPRRSSGYGERLALATSCTRGPPGP